MTTGNYESVRACGFPWRIGITFGELEEGREGDWSVLRFLLFTGVKGVRMSWIWDGCERRKGLCSFEGEILFSIEESMSK